MQGTCQTLGVLFNHQLLHEVAAVPLQMRKRGRERYVAEQNSGTCVLLNHTSYHGFRFLSVSPHPH